MSETPLPIAFLGTGLMGAPMAHRLLGAGYPVTVWNRHRAKTRELERSGARVANSPAQAVTNADVIITMLSDGAAVTEVLFESDVILALKAGAVMIDMSSIAPDVAREHAAKLAANGIEHLDAPVSGGTRGAAQGTLAIMVGGTSSAFERAQPMLLAMGRPTHIGPSGSGQVAKLANQSIVAITIGAVAEALLLAAASGADPNKVKHALTGGFADSAILSQHGQRMLDRRWVPGGELRLQVKDLRTVLRLAADLRLNLPLSKRIARLFEDAQQGGFGTFDHSALLLELERMNPGFRVGEKPDQRPENA